MTGANWIGVKPQAGCAEGRELLHNVSEKRVYRAIFFGDARRWETRRCDQLELPTQKWGVRKNTQL